MRTWVWVWVWCAPATSWEVCGVIYRAGGTGWPGVWVCWLVRVDWAGYTIA